MEEFPADWKESISVKVMFKSSWYLLFRAWWTKLQISGT